MKLAKLSLAAIAVVGLSTSSFAADTLADAFKDGKLKGAVKAYYFDKDTGTSQDIFVTGVMLNYVTDSFKGVKFGATFQSSNTPFVDNANVSSFLKTMDASGAQLSEAYLAYTMDKTTVKVGRQYIGTKLVAGSGSRMIKQAFEGVTVVNTNIPATTLTLAYVGKYQARTDEAGGVAQFEKTAIPEGAYEVQFVNKSVANLQLTGAYLNVKDSRSVIYGEAKYSGKTDAMTYSVAAQINDTSYDSNHATLANMDSGYYGAKVSIGMDALNAYVAYTSVNDDAKADNGVGSGTAATLYTATPVNAAVMNAGTDGFAVDVNYKMGAAKVGARYASVETGANVDIDTTALYGSYAFDGALKGLGLGLNYEDKDNGTDDNKALWFKAIYSF